MAYSNSKITKLEFGNMSIHLLLISKVGVKFLLEQHWLNVSMYLRIILLGIQTKSLNL